MTRLKQRRLLVASGVAVLGLLASACGSDEKTTSTSAAATTVATTTAESTVESSTADTSAADSSAAAAPETSAVASSAAEPLEPANIHIGIIGATGGQSALYAAIEQGYMDDEALSIEITNLQGSGGPAMAALVSGSVDMMSTGTMTLMSAVGTGTVDAKLFYQLVESTFDIVGKPGSTGLDDIADGGTIGVTGTGSQDQAWFQYAVKKAGLDPSKFSFVTAGASPERVAGLSAGAYDAIAVANTYAGQYGDAVVLIDGEEAGNSFPSIAMGSTTEYLDANGDVVERFVRAMNRGGIFVREAANRDLVIEYCSKYSGATPEQCTVETDKRLSEDPEWNFSDDGALHIEGLESLLAVYKEVNPEGAGNVTVAGVIDERFIEAARD